METDRGCRLDQAQVTAVPPDTFQVLATRLCGAASTLCWERYAVVGDKVIPQGETCEAQSTMGGRPKLTEPKPEDPSP